MTDVKNQDLGASDELRSPESITIDLLDDIVERNQVWPVMAAKYGVENPLPPWKTSLDGLCDVLDRGGLYCMPQPEARLGWGIKRFTPTAYTRAVGLATRVST